MRRLTAVVTIVAGILFSVGSLAIGVPSRADDGEDVIDAAELTFDDQNLAQLEQEHELFTRASDELTATALPRLARLLDLTQSEFTALLEDRYPDVATGIEELPNTRELTELVLTTARAGQGNVDDAGDLAIGGIGLVTWAWAVIVLGAAMVVLGVWVWRSATWGSVALVLGLGVALAIGPFAVGFPARLDSALEVFDRFRPFDESRVDSRRQPILTTDAMVRQIQDELLPDSARALGVSVEDLSRTLTEGLEDLQAGTEQFEEIRDDFLVEVDTLAFAIPRLARIDDLPLTSLSWLMTVPGVLMALAAGAALAAQRSPRGASP